MKKLSLYAAGASLVYFTTVICVPVAARALPATPLIITEVQPGTSGSASEEYIELFNISDKTIDLAANHWQLEVASASAEDWNSPYRTVALTGAIEPGVSYVIGSTYTSSGVVVRYLDGIAGARFSAGLSATGGHVRLRYGTYQVAADGRHY